MEIHGNRAVPARARIRHFVSRAVQTRLLHRILGPDAGIGIAEPTAFGEIRRNHHELMTGSSLQKKNIVRRGYLEQFTQSLPRVLM